MYICNCNAINTKKAQNAIEKGAKTAREIYFANGCKVQCGKCLNEMIDFVEQKVQDYRIAS